MNKTLFKNPVRLIFGVLILTIAVFLSRVDAQSSEVGRPFSKTYLPTDYRNSAQVWASIQDERGVMYFGMTGSKGLMEFDGQHWDYIEVPNKTTVFSFAKDESNALFAGAIGDFAMLELDNFGNRKWKSLKSLLKDTTLTFRAIWQTEAIGKKVAFQSVEALFIYDPEAPEPIFIIKTTAEDNFVCLFVHEGQFFVLKKMSGIFRVSANGLSLVSDALSPETFRAAISASPENLIIGTRKGGFFSVNSQTGIKTSLPDFGGAAYSKEPVYFARKISSGNMLFAGSTFGVFEANPNGTVLQFWNDANAFQASTNTVYHLYEGNGGKLWFTTSNGIVKADAGIGWSLWDKQNGLKGTVTDVIRFEGRLYVTTTDLIYELSGSVVRPLESAIPGQYWMFNVITDAEAKKRLLVGSQFGVHEIKGSTISLLRPGNHASFLYADKKRPGLFIVRDNLKLYRVSFNKNKVVEHGVLEGLRDNVMFLEQETDGTLWLGTMDNGVIQVKEDSLERPIQKRFGEADGLPDKNMVYPFVLENQIVFGTKKGLVVFNKAKQIFEPFEHPAAKKLVNRDVYRIYPNHSKGITVLPRSSLSGEAGRIEGSGDAAVWNGRFFKRLPEMEYEMAYEEDGAIWIGGSAGLFRYIAQSQSEIKSTFKALLKSVQYGSEKSLPTIQTEPAIIPFIENSFHFSFAAPFFEQDIPVLFSYRIKGFSDEWSRWKADNTADFNYLMEGKYAFEVKARNIYGDESEPAVFRFVVLPPWYRTWAAYSTYLVFGSMLLGFVVMLTGKIVRSRGEKQRRQQQLVSKQLLERQETERQRIARDLHDSLGQEILLMKYGAARKLMDPNLSGESKEILESHEKAASLLLQHTRQLAMNLRPPELDKLGLSETLRAMLSRIRDQNLVGIIGQIDEVDGLFDPADEINIVRIVQEAINNIIKHAKASQAEIILRVEDDILLTIADNGTGMAIKEEDSRGMGLHDMRERAEASGGTLSIVSDGGTKLIFRFPKKDINQ